MVQFNQNEIGTARLVHAISAAFSLLGSSFVIVSHWRRTAASPFPMKLAFYLSLCYFMTAFAGLAAFLFLHDLQDDISEVPLPFCYMQAIMFFYSKMAAALWITSIAFTVYRMIIRLDTEMERFERYFHAVNWGVPAILCSAMTAVDLFGREQVFCFIVDEKIDTGMGFFVPVIIFTIMVDIYLYYKVLRGIKHHQSEISQGLIDKARYNQYEDKLNRRIMHVITVFIFTYLWVMIFGVYRLFDQSRDFYLLCLDHFFVPLEGFWNSLVYGDNKRIRKKLGFAVIKKKNNDENHANNIQPIIRTPPNYCS